MCKSRRAGTLAGFSSRRHGYTLELVATGATTVVRQSASRRHSERGGITGISTYVRLTLACVNVFPFGGQALVEAWVALLGTPQRSTCATRGCVVLPGPR